MADGRARHLRKNLTVAEARLWKELRELRPHGYHFRRQAPVGRYVVDFACFSQRLIIEVDGIQHETPEGRRSDVARDADLQWRGFKVLRFANGHISEGLDGVMLEILHALGAIEQQEQNGWRGPDVVTPTPNPSPQGGGEYACARCSRYDMVAAPSGPKLMVRT